jgi:hypothetical protein
MSNPNLKARRAKSWRNGQMRKAARIEAQKRRESVNKALEPQSRPWSLAQSKRSEKRRPLQERYRQLHKGDLGFTVLSTQ